MLAGAFALLLWLGFWTWAFSFAYSDSYFAYSRCSRIGVFVAAMIGIVGITAGAWHARRNSRSVAGALLRQVLASLASLGPLALTSFVLSRAPEPCHLSGDDAMGAGINFLLLCVVASMSLVWAGVMVWRRRGS